MVYIIITQAMTMGKGVNRLVPLTVAGVALAVYGETLAPGLTWAHDGADGGDLAAAVLTGGVPHPPGYPLYLILGTLATALASSWDASRTLALLSALSSSLAAACLCAAVMALTAPAEGMSFPVGLVGSASGLAVAFSPLVWSQAVIAEVYALHALLVSLALLLTVVIDRRSSGHGILLVLLFLVAGLGVGHHPSFVLLVPGLAAWMIRAPWLRQVDRRTWVVASGAFLLSQGIYIILPVRARSDPLINWGDASSLPGFLWLVTAQAYRPYLFGVSLADIIPRLGVWAQKILATFSVPGMAIALYGLTKVDGRVSLVTIPGVILISLSALLYGTADFYVYLVPVVIIMGLWLGWGLAEVVSALGTQGWRRRLAAGVVILAIPLLLLVTGWPTSDASQDRRAMTFVDEAFAILPPRAVVVSWSDEQTFALWYGQATHQRHDMVVVDWDLTQYAWYRAQLRRRWPELAPLPESDDPALVMPALIRLAIPARPVYVPRGRPELSTATLAPAGSWWRVSALP